MTNSNDRSSCRESLDWLQRRLDGASTPKTASVADHVRDCTSCRERIRAADQLLAAMATPSGRRAPTPLMTERIVRAVERDRRQWRIRRWAAVGTALAAAVVLAVWLSNAGNRTTVTPAMSLRQSAFDAGEAVVGLTKRATSETVGETRLLVPRIEMPKFVNSSLALAAGPIENTGRNMAEGLEPVTNSARRAVNLFLRDSGRSTVEKDKTNSVRERPRG